MTVDPTHPVPLDPHELAALYALDALERDEEEIFRRHLERCRACQDEVAQLRTATTALAESTRTPLPPDLRIRILDQVSSTSQLPSRPPMANLPEERRPSAQSAAAGGRHSAPARYRRIVMAAAAAVLAVAGTATALAFVGRFSGGPVDGVEAVAAADDARSLALDGDTGSVRVVWSAGGDQVAIVADGLPDPGVGRRYQLWRLESREDGEAAVPSELFGPDDTGAVRVVAPLGGEPAGWAVTIEPDSGSPQPTGEILYLGQL